jgi:hypothetical protein
MAEVCTYVQVPEFMCTIICVHVRAFTCMRVRACVQYVCVCMCVCACQYGCVRVYVCEHVHMHAKQR